MFANIREHSVHYEEYTTCGEVDLPYSVFGNFREYAHLEIFAMVRYITKAAGRMIWSVVCLLIFATVQREQDLLNHLLPGYDLFCKYSVCSEEYV